MTGIRNPATERADRILDLLDNPTQRSGERGYGRQGVPGVIVGPESPSPSRWPEWLQGHIRAQVRRERALVSLRSLCANEAEFTAARGRVGDIVASGVTEATAVGAVTAAKQSGADDPWIAHQIAVRGPRSGWSMLNWALFLDHIADWPNRDDLAALPETTNASPRAVAGALALIERHAMEGTPVTAVDLVNLGSDPIAWADPVRSSPLDDLQQWLDTYEYDAERHP